MTGKHFDGLSAALRDRLVRSRAVGLNDAQTGDELAFAALRYLEQLPATWRIQ